MNVQRPRAERMFPTERMSLLQAREVFCGGMYSTISMRRSLSCTRWVACNDGWFGGIGSKSTGWRGRGLWHLSKVVWVAVQYENLPYCNSKRHDMYEIRARHVSFAIKNDVGGSSVAKCVVHEGHHGKAALDWITETYQLDRANINNLKKKLDRMLVALQDIDPSRTSLSLDKDFFPKAELLEGLSPGLTLKVFSRYPEEFAHPDAVDYWRIMAALVYTAGFSPEAVASLFSRHICLFARTVQDPENLKRLFEWLQNLGLREKDVAKLIDRYPLILQINVSDVLIPRIEYMSALTNGKRERVIKAICRHPEILGVDTLFIQQRVDYFLNDIGLSQKDVGNLFVAQPSLFTCSIEETLRPAIMCLQNELQPAEDREYFKTAKNQSEDNVTQSSGEMPTGLLLHRLVVAGGVLSRSPQTLQGRIDSWRQLGFNQEDICLALWRFPRLLLYPINELKYKRKIDFLNEEMNLDPSALTAFPQFISYSLENRIAPRVAVAKGLRGTIPSLYMLALKDEAFYKSLGVTHEEAVAFLESWCQSPEAQKWL